MSEPTFTVILNGEGEILNLSGSVSLLAEGIRKRLIGIPLSPPSNDCAKTERAYSGYVAEVIDKQRAIAATLVRAIADLEALNAETPSDKTEAAQGYGGGAATGGVGTHLGGIFCGTVKNR